MKASRALQTHIVGTLRTQMEGQMSSLHQKASAITQLFQLKQNETQENSVSICNVNTKSLLRAQKLNCVYLP